MGFRFRKSLKLLPGLRVNISKTGASLSLGGKGLTYNIGKKGTRTTIGVPGTGMSHSNYTPYDDKKSANLRSNTTRILYIIFAALIIAAVYGFR